MAVPLRLAYDTRDRRHGDGRRRVLSEVEHVRRAYGDRYAEIQMIVPANILNASGEVNAVLAEVDAAVKRLDRRLERYGIAPAWNAPGGARM